MKYDNLNLVSLSDVVTDNYRGLLRGATPPAWSVDLPSQHKRPHYERAEIKGFLGSRRATTPDDFFEIVLCIVVLVGPT